MSTFDGHVAEFPDIRIDYFRSSGAETKPALAYFLSHVHSDHLVGLESCKSPFIYCSSATRDILLRLEKYPHRMNFARGVLETRKQTYRHLKNLLKAIPLETPTSIELCPGKKVRVTLFDANHCVGAVMFLIEGDGRAILYTGDIRSEGWWVDRLARSPMLLPYAVQAGLVPRQRLDCIYLDTTFVVTGREDSYSRFPSKAEGLSELLNKVSKYPQDTVFYLNAWTFGYEDVWQALSSALDSRVHVDEYRWGLYRALTNGVEPKAAEAAQMVGFYCGNHFQRGCLSGDSNECRIHSCERGTGCEIWNHDFVRITPIISRYNGAEIAELGAGGGQGDLDQRCELEVSDTALVGKLIALCTEKLADQPKLLSSVLHMLTEVIDDGVQTIKLTESSLTAEADPDDTNGNAAGSLEDMPIDKLIPILSKLVINEAKAKSSKSNGLSTRYKSTDERKRSDGLPNSITFPYSRHSSHRELCLLVEAFRPNDIYPCTVDEVNWRPSSSMRSLFGHVYTEKPPAFTHDRMMFMKKGITTEYPGRRSRPVSPRSSFSQYATPTGQTSPPMPHGAMNTASGSSRHDPHGDDPRQRSSSIRQDLSNKRRRSSREPQQIKWPLTTDGGMSLEHVRRDRTWSHNEHDMTIQPPLQRESTMPASHRAFLNDAVCRSGHEESDKRIASNPSAVCESNRIPAVPQLRSAMAKDVQLDRRKDTDAQGLIGTLSSASTSDEDTTLVGIEPVSDAKRYDRDQLQEPTSPPSTNDARLNNMSNAVVSAPYSSALTSSPAADRLAFRREVHDAVLGLNGSSWHDISLVSVNDYQEREEEL